MSSSNLQSDICGHDPYIWGANNHPPHNIKLDVHVDHIHTTDVNISGSGAWVSVFTVFFPGPGQEFTVDGTGVVAGFDDVYVLFQGSIGNGTITGKYTFGVDGHGVGDGGLPPCDDDAFPGTLPQSHAAVYGVKMKAITPTLTPDPDDDTPTPSPTDAFCIILGSDSCTPSPTPPTAPTATATFVPTAAPTPPITHHPGDGDVNSSGHVNPEDALLILQHVGAMIMLDGTAAASADTDLDDIITAIDAQLVLQLVADLIDTLPFSH